MVHDLFANFYCKSNDKEPKYRCPLGIFTKGEDFLVKEGFKRAEEPYYQDYEKEVSECELSEWTQKDYVSEVMDVIYSGEDFERIVLEALMLEAYDDKGTIPERMVQLNDITVTFSNTEPTSPVLFQKDDEKKNAENFTVPLHSLKEIFGDLTLMEVMSGLQEFGEHLSWTIKQWEVYLKGKGAKRDMFFSAHFYEKKSDKEPRYISPMGIIKAVPEEFLLSNGFIKRTDLDEGNYDKYSASWEDLAICDNTGYLSELIEVDSRTEGFERIRITAAWWTGKTVRGSHIGDTFVELAGTEYNSLVRFIKRNPHKITPEIETFSVSMKNLRKKFRTITQHEIVNRLKKRFSGSNTAFDDMKAFLGDMLEENN